MSEPWPLAPRRPIAGHPRRPPGHTARPSSKIRQVSQGDRPQPQNGTSSVQRSCFKIQLPRSREHPLPRCQAEAHAGGARSPIPPVRRCRQARTVVGRRSWAWAWAVGEGRSRGSGTVARGHGHGHRYPRPISAPRQCPRSRRGSAGAWSWSWSWSCSRRDPGPASASASASAGHGARCRRPRPRSSRPR